MTTVSAPPFRVPIVDAGGLLTREWANFFRELYARNGGFDAPSNAALAIDVGQFQLQPPPEPVEPPQEPFDPAELREQIADLYRIIDGLMQGTTP